MYFYMSRYEILMHVHVVLSFEALKQYNQSFAALGLNYKYAKSFY